MSDTAIGPATAKGALWAVLALILAVGLLWTREGRSAPENTKIIQTYASLCPRWVKLAEELLPVEGVLPERCQYLGTGDSLRKANHLYQATPNIVVLVNAQDTNAAAPTSVEISDTKSKASVTYNAEALALLK